MLEDNEIPKEMTHALCKQTSKKCYRCCGKEEREMEEPISPKGPVMLILTKCRFLGMIIEDYVEFWIAFKGILQLLQIPGDQDGKLLSLESRRRLCAAIVQLGQQLLNIVKFHIRVHNLDAKAKYLPTHIREYRDKVSRRRQDMRSMVRMGLRNSSSKTQSIVFVTPSAASFAEMLVML
ncbi:hypothetical protein F53441_8126 [Fusarium austroafricanum]|uniref:Uncharacterized protein n=1 Tax=Fusarium austroafricanum TaxID=2364996 RepID=A0A8H4NWV0_9HYPO|nr:hypothetical protein F53441_8126 [Fusarium austroafricanum]